MAFRGLETEGAKERRLARKLPVWAGWFLAKMMPFIKGESLNDDKK